MLLLTGASGTVGSAMLRRLVGAGMPVRCLVRDPKELGAERVRVQIALGDLADPPSFRNAMRGVDTVVHLAGRALFQPIWAEDVADCAMAVLHGSPAGRYELAGPDTLSHEDIVRLVLRSFGRARPLVHVPTPLVSRGLRVLEAALQGKAPAVWDEAELLEVSVVASRGTADAADLGVVPRAMAEVLGAE